MTRDDLLGVLRPFGEATPLPRAAFVDPAALDLEERAIFSSSWIPVAHEADLARPGDWVRAPALADPPNVATSTSCEVTERLLSSQYS